jgi:hypothetical protein
MTATETKTTKAGWTHKVVKTQRGGQGQWFRYPAAKTGSQAECEAYAEQFAREQTAAGVAGTLILVVARKGDAVVKSFAV